MNFHYDTSNVQCRVLADIDSVVYNSQHIRLYSSGSSESFIINNVDSVTYSEGGPANSPLLASVVVYPISTGTARVRGFISSQGGSPVTSRGVCWSTDQNPTIADQMATAGGGINGYQAFVDGLLPSTTYYFRSFATNVFGTAYGNQLRLTTWGNALPWLNSSLTYGSVSDIENNSYATITIGTQVWMAENLRTATFANGEAIPHIYSPEGNGTYEPRWSSYQDQPLYDHPFGKYYSWTAVNDPRGLCPTGWHVATRAEWDTLVSYLGGGAEASGAMKSIGTLEDGTGLWSAPNQGATNSSGFSGVPAGWRNVTGVSMDLSNSEQWWTSTQINTNNAYVVYQLWYYGSTPSTVSAAVSYNHSVRCMQD